MRAQEKDVIVVGSGPAGTSCATYLAMAGVDVLLVDRELWPRDKPCTDVQSTNTTKHVARFGALDELMAIGSRVCHAMFTNSRYESIVVDVRESSYGFITPRWYYDDLMRRVAIRHGVDMWQNCWVYDLIHEDGYVRGIKAQYMGEAIEIRSKIVVGADGAHSIVAQKMHMFPDEDASVAPALRAYFRGVTLDPRYALSHEHCYFQFTFDEALFPGSGYFWIAPSGKNSVTDGFCDVGVGITDRSDYTEKKEALTLRTERWIRESPVGKKCFQHAERVSPWKGWRPNDCYPRMRNCGNGFMLCGDAGSTIIPLIDEGVSSACDSGQWAAEAAEAALKAHDYSDEFLYERYPKKFDSAYNDRVKIIKIAQAAMYDTSMMTNLIHRCKVDAAFKERCFEKMFVG